MQRPFRPRVALLLLASVVSVAVAFVPHRLGRALAPLSSADVAGCGARSRDARRAPASRGVSRRARLSRMRVGMETDYYELLGLTKGADERAIKSGFRKMAREFHPDVNPSPEAAKKFAKINNAYQVLSDPETKQRYDMFGEAGVSGQGGGRGGGGGVEVNLEDIFDSFFGGGGGGGMPGGMGGMGGMGGRQQQRRRNGPVPGEDLRYDLTIDFRTAIFGGREGIKVRHLETCDTCTGSGVKPGSKVRSCGTCGGQGIVAQVTRTPLGNFQTQTTCPTCRGTGEQVDEYCGSCSGKGVVQKTKSVKVTVPCGVEDGNKLRVRGEGDAGLKGGPTGDLYIFLTVAKDNEFRREGQDIYSSLDVTYLDAILGRVKRVSTVDGPVDIKIPAGTQPETVLRVKGKGAPELNKEERRGDQYVTVKVSIPKSLSKQEQDIIAALDSLSLADA